MSPILPAWPVRLIGHPSYLASLTDWSLIFWLVYRKSLFVKIFYIICFVRFCPILPSNHQNFWNRSSSQIIHPYSDYSSNTLNYSSNTPNYPTNIYLCRKFWECSISQIIHPILWIIRPVLQIICLIFISAKKNIENILLLKLSLQCSELSS